MIHPDGAISVDGKPVRVEDLPKGLHSAGFARTSLVHIGIPEELPPATLTKVSSVLASNGYQSVLFVKPRTSRVRADEDPKSRQAAKPVQTVAPYPAR